MTSIAPDPDLTEEELQRRSETADALWRELVRRAGGGDAIEHGRSTTSVVAQVIGFAAFLVLIAWMLQLNGLLLPFDVWIFGADQRVPGLPAWPPFCDGPIASPVCIFVTPFACLLVVGWG